jgi:hypothetical protein
MSYNKKVKFMNKKVLTLIFLFSLVIMPAYSSTPIWTDEQVAQINALSVTYPTKKQSDYLHKLLDNYYKKYYKDISPTKGVLNAPQNAYYEEVDKPYYEFCVKTGYYKDVKQINKEIIERYKNVKGF